MDNGSELAGKAAFGRRGCVVVSGSRACRDSSGDSGGVRGWRCRFDGFSAAARTGMHDAIAGAGLSLARGAGVMGVPVPVPCNARGCAGTGTGRGQASSFTRRQQDPDVRSMRPSAMSVCSVVETVALRAAAR